MNILCKIFGHKPPWYGKNVGAEYGRISQTATDGIGRVHATIKAECPRCEKEYFVTRIHLPENSSK